jgi:hypothetical protein
MLLVGKSFLPLLHELNREMEGDLQDIQSKSLSRSHIQNLLGLVSDAAAEAADLRDQELVKDPAMRKALSVVEDFLRSSKRVCYGGMAINAHLPSSLKFYDFAKVLPDYDFFTPEPDADVATLTRKLKDAGFSEISARVGMHEGTTKVFVNYTAVADITETPNWLYHLLLKRSIVEDGIHYADADFLRMNMYLELSRPRGEVERWDKVYKRLLLLNQGGNHKNLCKTKKRANHVSKEVHELIMDYIINMNLIFAGAELERIYKHPMTKSAGFVLKGTAPIIVFAESPELHISIVRQILKKSEPNSNVSIVHWAPVGEMVPELYGIRMNGHLVFLCVKEIYCNSYNEVSIPGRRSLRIASLDTAITLFYSLTFAKGLDGIVSKSIGCFASTLVEISRTTRDAGKKSVFPLFSTSCSGHQPSKPSLLRAKASRIRRIKEAKTRKVGNSL